MTHRNNPSLPQPPVDMAAVNTELANLKAQLGEVEARMAGYLRELGLDG